MNRRNFVSRLLKTSVVTGAATVLPGSLKASMPALPTTFSEPEEAAKDEAFWEQIKDAYHVNPGILYLNNGGSSATAQVTFDDENYHRNMAKNAPSYYLWRSQSRQREVVRRTLGQYLGCDHEEIAMLRSTTEALVTVIQGLDLPSGSEIITTIQDYPTMLHTLHLYAHRRGWKITELELPMPLGTQEEVINQVTGAFTKDTRFLLLSDILFRTGERLPIREICEAARQHNILTAVDGAHTVGHFPVVPEELGCHFFASSLHKWLSAPIGTGILWVDKDQILPLWPMYGALEGEENDIRKFEHIGTRSLASDLAIGSAIDFDLQIGAERKLARLQYLTRHWWNQLKEIDGIESRTNMDSPQRYGAIASFTCPKKGSRFLDDWLNTNRNIIISRITFQDEVLFRVSPHVYVLPRDLDKLVEGVKAYLS